MGKKSKGGTAGPSQTHSRGSKHQRAALDHATREGQSRASASTDSASGTRIPRDDVPRRGPKRPTEVKLSNFIPVTQITRLFRGAATRTTTVAHPNDSRVQCTVTTDARGFVTGAIRTDLPAFRAEEQATGSGEQVAHQVDDGQSAHSLTNLEVFSAFSEFVPGRYEHTSGGDASSEPVREKAPPVTFKKNVTGRKMPKFVMRGSVAGTPYSEYWSSTLNDDLQCELTEESGMHCISSTAATSPSHCNCRPTRNPHC